MKPVPTEAGPRTAEGAAGEPALAAGASGLAAGEEAEAPRRPVAEEPEWVDVDAAPTEIGVLELDSAIVDVVDPITGVAPVGLVAVAADGLED